MKTKKRITISIDNGLLNQIDKECSLLKWNRSEYIEDKLRNNIKTNTNDILTDILTEMKKITQKMNT